MRMPKTAVLYLRVSRREQQDPETQAQALHAWWKERGWAVVAVHSDRITGDPGRRRGDPAGLRAALQVIADRSADVLVVFSADRLVRSPAELLQVVERIRQLGGHVASYQDRGDLDTTTDAGELLVFMRGWWARMQLRLTRAGTIAGLARARAAGKQLGRPLVALPDLGQVAACRKRGLGPRKIALELGCGEWAARKAIERLCCSS